MGIVHRDIKPDNVFVGRDGRVRLADFGIAHVDDAVATRATVAGAVLGTPGYMSPEQIRGLTVDARSDLFSVGIVAYEMLTGSNPFDSSEGADATTLLYRIVHEPAPVDPLSSDMLPNLSPSMRKANFSALEKDPLDRPQTAEEFKKMLHGDAVVSPRSPKWLPYALVGLAGVNVLAVVLFGAMSGSSGGGSVLLENATATEVQVEDGAKTAGAKGGSETEEAGESEKKPREVADYKASAQKVSQPETGAWAQSEEVPASAVAEAPSSFPRKWTGTYVGRTVHTDSGTIDRNVDMEFTQVSDDGTLRGACHVGRGQEGYVQGSYNVGGTIDWDTGAIRLEGTSWIDQGGMESWGGFAGTVSFSSQTIDGEWYDPTGEATGSSPWHMSAS